MKKALITGIYGQDGAYLAQFLIGIGYKVFGGARRSSQDVTYRLRALGIEDKIQIVNFDLSDPYCIADVIRDGGFDEIYNLAAQSFVGSSWDMSLYTSNVNAMGTLYILDALKRFSPETKFYQASTSEMFGQVRESPQNENTAFNPRSPYGVSKLFAHEMTRNYRDSFGLFLTSGILFNHESPLRGNEFVTKKIVREMVQIKLGKLKKMHVGNLDSKRDWGYAPEYVQGMYKMLQHSEPDDFVLATGKTTTVREFIELVANTLDIEITWRGKGSNEFGENKSGVPIVEVSKKFFRPAEVDLLLGDAKKAKELLGWQAKTGVIQLAKIMVNFELNKQNAD